jgi:hypothetical protein
MIRLVTVTVIPVLRPEKIVDMKRSMMKQQKVPVTIKIRDISQYRSPVWDLDILDSRSTTLFKYRCDTPIKKLRNPKHCSKNQTMILLQVTICLEIPNFL